MAQNVTALEGGQEISNTYKAVIFVVEHVLVYLLKDKQ